MHNVFMDGGSASDGERAGVDEDCPLANAFFLFAWCDARSFWRAR